MICVLKILSIFTSLSFIIGAEMPEFTEGFFYSLKNKDVALPCINRNSLYSSDEELSKGRGDIPIYCRYRTFYQMLENSLGATAQSKAISADEILNDLLSCDDVSNLRKTLQSTTVETLVNEDDHYSRDRVYCYFLALNDFFDKLEAYQNQPKLKIAS